MSDYENTKTDLRERFGQLVRQARVLDKRTVLEFGKPPPTNHDERKKAATKAVRDVVDHFIDCVIHGVFTGGNDLVQEVQGYSDDLCAILNLAFPPGSHDVEARRHALSVVREHNQPCYPWLREKRKDFFTLRGAFDCMEKGLADLILTEFPILRDRQCDEPSQPEEESETETLSGNEEPVTKTLEAPIIFSKKRKLDAVQPEPGTPARRATKTTTPRAPKQRRVSRPVPPEGMPKCKLFANSVDDEEEGKVVTIFDEEGVKWVAVRV